MLKDFKPRLYQETIFATAVNHNTLVVLPTGLGKTIIAAMLAIKRLDLYPDSKILILAPTKPLIDQHLASFKSYLHYPEEKMVVLSGSVAPERREGLYKDKNIFFSTPQTIQNDIVNRSFDFKDFSLVVFDEAHRATGDYSYVWLAKHYADTSKHPRILALTASPGSDSPTISEVAKNLHIEKIEVRTEDDGDVKPYTFSTNIKWVEVDLPPEMIEVKNLLQKTFSARIESLKRIGFFKDKDSRYISKKDILGLQAALHAELSMGDKASETFEGLSLTAECMKLQHALELVESQGIMPLHEYLERLFTEVHTTKVKAVKSICMDINVRTAYLKTKTLFDNETEHPKMKEVKRLIIKELHNNTNKEKKIIIFTQYRNTGQKIVEEINKTFAEAETPITAKLFVGQQKKNGSGLSQKEQKMTIQEFRDGIFNCLVATSVAEEGLDIPNVDCIIFYEPIPSAIRTIQRKGRTGRFEKGAVYVLCARNTRDIAYKWSAHHKQKAMYNTLKEMKRDIELAAPSVKQEKNILDYAETKNSAAPSTVAKKTEEVGEEKVVEHPQKENAAEEDEQTAKGPDVELKIYLDVREKSSALVRHLMENKVEINFRQLEVGDIIISNRVAAERKTTKDFVDSIIDRRLLQQVKDLKASYEKPFLIIEGNENIYSQRNVHPNAIRGMMATIAIDYGMPIICTQNEQDTASYIIQIAKREQKESSDFSMHAHKSVMTPNQELEYIISSLPGVGPNIAKRLLERFKNVQSIMNASVKELSSVEGVGRGIAIKIKETVERSYRN